MRKKWIILLFALITFPSVYSQNNDKLIVDEGVLNASTKQVNQFFRRFNGEESTKGVRYYEGDKDYRNPSLRNKYLNVLFDNSNASITDPVKNDFIKKVINQSNPEFLDFHGDGWFAEVITKFLYQGADVYITLYMNLEKENEGYKWVMNDVYFPHFKSLFSNHNDNTPRFLHPMSHEIDFMNLIRVFRDKDYVDKYVKKDFEPDYLSLFLYELKKGNLKYQSVTNLKFHFFQIEGWYFEISDFNRPGANSGWLISNLMKIERQEDIETINKFIRHEDEN
ncbi:MAG TPA: hypothetical protein VK212_08740 [Lentimicrobium sp.]|nr:hypothetical protein [Lentimicrobium sp.]